MLSCAAQISEAETGSARKIWEAEEASAAEPPRYDLSGGYMLSRKIVSEDA